MTVRLPEVPAGLDDKTKDFLQAVRDILEQREGLRTDKSKAFMTKADLNDGWILPDLFNLRSGWTRYSETTESPAFCRTADGFVAIKGVVAGGSVGSTDSIFILPFGYRPLYRVSLPTITNTGIGQIDIEPTGEVRPISGGTTWFSINIIFRHG